MLRFRNLVLLVLCCLLLLTGCQKRPASTADVPRVLSPRYSIAVVPFSQPTEACNLIMGHLPENQGCIPANQLMQLDNELRTLLTSRESVRSVSFEKTLPAFLAASTSFRATSEPQALPGWAKFAKKTGKDFILVPQVLDWHEREGSAAGVTKSASVHIEFYLIRTETGTVHSHQVFREKQEGLTSNLLTVGDFFKRKGAWVTGLDLAREGMTMMLQDMGLLSPYAQQSAAQGKK